MTVLEKESGKTVRCGNCGFTEKMDVFKENLQAARTGGRVNKKMIETYSDKEAIGTNLGDLLKMALKQGGD